MKEFVLWKITAGGVTAFDQFNWMRLDWLNAILHS